MQALLLQEDADDTCRSYREAVEVRYIHALESCVVTDSWIMGIGIIREA